MGGICTSKQTSSTSIPESSQEEKALISLMTDGVMPAYFDEAGYELTKEEVPIEKDPKYQALKTKTKAALASLNKAKTQPTQKPTMSYGGQVNYGVGGEPSNKAQKQKEYDDAVNEMNDYSSNYVPEVTYKQRKKGSAETEAILEKYGPDSIKYKAAVAKELKAKIAEEKTINEITKKGYEVVKKYLSGDYSVTTEQKNLIAENNAPIKAAVESLYNDTISKLEKSSEAMRKEAKTTKAEQIREIEITEGSLLNKLSETFQNYKAAIKDTSISVLDSLSAVGSQILETGKGMEDSLKDVIGANKELLKIGIEDKTGELTRRVASNAALLGRSPDDPEYQQEIQTSIAKEIKSGTLSLSSMEAQGMLSIRERTGSQLEQMLMSKAQFLESQGGKLEGAALQEGQAGLGIRAETGAKKERARMENITGGEQQGILQAAQQRGMQNIGLEEGVANQLWQVGSGMAPSQAQLGFGASEFSQAQNQQNLINTGSLAALPSSLSQYYFSERAAQPTTTQTSQGSILGMLTGLAGGAVKAYTGIKGADFLSKLINEGK